MTTEVSINVWRRRLRIICAGSMSGRGRTIAVLATISGFLAFSGVALAGAAQVHREGLAGTAATSSEADLVMTMAASGLAAPGEPVSFRATVTNDGPDTAQNVVVTDTSIPTTFINVTWPFGVASCTTPRLGGVGTITCNAPSLAPGFSLTLTVNLRARCWSNGQAVWNGATATSTTNDPNTSNNTASGLVRCGL